MEASEIESSIKNKYVHNKNVRIEQINSQLEYYSYKYCFNSKDNFSNTEFNRIEPEIAAYWKSLMQKRSQGISDITYNSYRRIVESTQYYFFKTGRYSMNYIPDGVFYSLIDPFFNSEQFANQFDNKSYYPLIFHDIPQPKTIALKLGGTWFNHRYECVYMDDVYNKCFDYPEIVIKFSRDSSGGNGVFFWSNYSKSEFMNFVDVSSADMIIQEPIVQHDCLFQIHSESVNTVRIMTLLFRGEALILSSVLRMGVGSNRKDNASSGGIVCGINNDGSLKDIAYDKYGNTYSSHPQGGQFGKIIIPCFLELEELAKKLQYRFPYCKMISWDFAIDKNGDHILIEANMKRGEIDFHQFCNGPLFGDITCELLDYIVKKSL